MLKNDLSEELRSLRNYVEPNDRIVLLLERLSLHIGDGDAPYLLRKELVQATREAGEMYSKVLSENFEMEKRLGELEEMAMFDSLTGLYNRRYFDDSIEREVHAVNRWSSDSSIVLLDIDYFKSFNDDYGHQAGDYVLKELGGLIREETRKNDIPCRYGGEEFAVIMSSSDVEHSSLASEKLRKAVEDHSWNYKGKDLGKISVSVGASSILRGDDSQSVIDRVDKRMYRAKKEGRNRVVCD